MKLAGTLQGLIVVILVVVVTTWLLNRVDFMIVLIGSFASKGVAEVMPPITVVSVVAVGVAPITTVTVVVPTMVVAVIIATRWEFGALWPSHVFLDYLLSVIYVRVVFSDGEQLRDRGRPFLKQLASEGIMVMETLDEGQDCLIMRDLGGS
jgi:hypothetical protein